MWCPGIISFPSFWGKKVEIYLNCRMWKWSLHRIFPASLLYTRKRSWTSVGSITWTASPLGKIYFLLKPTKCHIFHCCLSILFYSFFVLNVFIADCNSETYMLGMERWQDGVSCIGCSFPSPRVLIPLNFQRPTLQHPWVRCPNPWRLIDQMHLN